jgi:hypothetical protein
MMCSARFLSYAHSKAFDDILSGYPPDIKTPSKNKVLDPKDDAKLILIRKMNGLAISALHSACRDSVSLMQLTILFLRLFPKAMPIKLG